ncbi:ferredoxin-type protein NapF [Lysobacter sp. TAF61]|uniref:ferredoxin-type protein NapF n=1 Tax=Lysobacter sp. TAF61 TaxID=3233072 RepID=UPI003F9AC0C2
MSAVPDRSRRALLLGRQAARTPLRPPWALAESEFVDACTGCGACVERCPEQVLVRGAGGYAVFDPRLGECTFCGDCVDACAPNALDRDVAAMPWHTLAVAGDACLPRHGVVCSSCRDACPERAIAFPLSTSVPTPVVDAARCNGCGACVGVCPVEAMAITHLEQA